MNLTLYKKNLQKNGTVILGISGGSDSMALCHAIMHQCKDIRIIAAHIDHGLRSESKEDAEFVKKAMSKWKIDCEHYKVCPPKSGNIEAWGRKTRYDFFEKLRKKYKADHILTAHHQGDDIETILMNLLRGTRVKGLSGMQTERNKLLRPLLFTPKSEILKYITTHKIPFREDPSNKEERYTRNFLRNKIIPMLTDIYPDFPKRWQAQKEYWTNIQNYFETQAQCFLNAHLSNEGLNRKEYKNLPYHMRSTVLELWFKQSTGCLVQSSKDLARWDSAIMKWHTGKKTEWHKKRFLIIKKTHALIE